MWLPLLVLISFVWLVLTRKTQIRENSKLPPGPRKLPILGNLHQLGALPHRSLWKLSKKHGPIMLLQLGAKPIVVVSSAEAAREVLKTHDLDCCSRPPLTGPKRLTYNFLDIAFAPYGQYWKEMRKLCITKLLSPKKVQSFQSVREEEVSLLIDSVYESASSGTPFDLSKGFFSLTAGIIFKIAMGKTFHGSEIDNVKLTRMVFEGQALLGSFCALDLFPYVGWTIDWLTGFHRRLGRSFHELDVFYQKVIDDHLVNSERNIIKEREDLVDVLLRLVNDQSEDSPIQLTIDNIKAILMDIFLAGIDTGALTLIWAMAELARNPMIMKKAQSEIRHYCCMGRNKGKLTEEDISELQYLKMIVKETLRLHPPGVLLLPRETLSKCKIGGYDVYPKTRIAVNVWAIGRDPNIRKNPEEFNPDRFIDSPIDFKGQHFELLPFGSSRRICPGMNMGVAIIELALANLLCFFDWKLPSGMEEMDIDIGIDMEEEASITVGKKTPLKLMPIHYKGMLN